MINHLLYFLIVLIVGEIIVNLTIFKYLRFKYQKDESKDKIVCESEGESINEKKTADTFLLINISIFKGILERFAIFLALVFNIPQILIVFGAIKIGTQLDKSKKTKNDYFIIGNIFTIIIAIIYQYIYIKWRYEISIVPLISNCS